MHIQTTGEKIYERSSAACAGSYAAGKNLAKNLIAVNQKQTIKPFAYFDKGNMLTSANSKLWLICQNLKPTRKPAATS